jgi:hypothetical protein
MPGRSKRNSGSSDPFARFYHVMSIWLNGKDPQVTWLYSDGSLDWMRDVEPGPIRHPAGQPYPEGTGFPSDFSPPQMIFPQRPSAWSSDQALPIADISESGGERFWVVSNQLRQIFLDMDPDAFKFHPLSILVGPEREIYEGPPYWLCEVVRYLDALDLEKTKHTVKDHGVGGIITYPNVWSTIYFKRSAVQSNHIFRLMFDPNKIYCSLAMRNAMVSAKIIARIVKSAAVCS